MVILKYFGIKTDDDKAGLMKNILIFLAGTHKCKWLIKIPLAIYKGRKIHG